ncbi:aldehyde oxidase GLOX-like [Bidens hawaiensis]|uniref:aldehyde oxidase GLOX-like n=1 Tax=Bidens hawaiensis TaxID=980011 RepID=UPI00404A7491
MAPKLNNLTFFILLTTFPLLPLTTSNHPSPPPSPPPPPPPTSQIHPQTPRKPLGTWALLHLSIGISAMHMQLLHNNKVVIFDRTDFGPSNLTLPFGEFCDEFLRTDCTAHSILYDVPSNTFRPLYVQTNVWCSSGTVNPAGTLVQTGGYFSGDRKIRLFTPCNDENCDWIELTRNLSVQRWYASNHILPDGNIIIVGGRRAYSYEFFPRNPAGMSPEKFFNLSFLLETTDYLEENNLYPFLHVLPDGNLFVFANQRSISLDYVNNRVVREYPILPGEKRSYPSTGSSILLPIRENFRFPATGSTEVEVMICGGARGGSFPMAERGVYMAAARTCGRMNLVGRDPYWVIEKMPLRRVMPDMILLPNGDVLIINGAGRGTAGWENAVEPALHPVLYELGKRLFTVLNPTRRARMYHSSASLLPDGRILVGGSNPHVAYEFSGVSYPTDLSLESFSPPYMDERFAYYRPSISSVEYESDESVSYGKYFTVMVTMTLSGLDRRIMVTLVAPSFTTHSFAMNQRVLVLRVEFVEQVSLFGYRVTVRAPSSPNVAPPGYYMMFVVHDKVPGHAVWIRLH